MKRILFLGLTFLLFSCQTLPAVHPPVSSNGKKSFTCPSPFLKQKYRLVHAIETSMAGTIQNAIIGVTLADPANRSVSCAILTTEGMTLFEAESGPAGIKIIRALPPLDSADFSKNMIEDIKLIYFAPEGQITEKGHLQNGETVCRYREENGDLIDVMADKSKGIEVRRYSTSGTLKRQVRFNKTPGNIYQRIELRADEQFNYSLLMTLIEAQPVKSKSLRTKLPGDRRK